MPKGWQPPALPPRQTEQPPRRERDHPPVQPPLRHLTGADRWAAEERMLEVPAPGRGQAIRQRLRLLGASLLLYPLLALGLAAAMGVSDAEQRYRDRIQNADSVSVRGIVTDSTWRRSSRHSSYKRYTITYPGPDGQGLLFRR